MNNFKTTELFRSAMIICAMALFSFQAKSQVGVGTTNPHSSAQLDVTSDGKGVLLPRLTTIERNAISSPATSLLIYNKSVDSFQFFDGAQWQNLISSSSAVGKNIYESDDTLTSTRTIYTDGTKNLRFKHGTPGQMGTIDIFNSNDYDYTFPGYTESYLNGIYLADSIDNVGLLIANTDWPGASITSSHIMQIDAEQLYLQSDRQMSLNSSLNSYEFINLPHLDTSRTSNYLLGIDNLGFWKSIDIDSLAHLSGSQWIDANINGSDLILASNAIGSNDTVVVTDNGNIGLGHSAPEAKIHAKFNGGHVALFEDSDMDLALSISSDVYGNSIDIVGYQNGYTGPAVEKHLIGYQGAFGSDNVAIDGGTIFIDENDNVSIGKNSKPKGKLDVQLGSFPTNLSFHTQYEGGGFDGVKWILKSYNTDSTFIGDSDGSDQAFFSSNRDITIIQNTSTASQVSLKADVTSISKVLRLTPQSSAPSSPSKGDIYFDNSTNKARCWDGTQWNDLW